MLNVSRFIEMPQLILLAASNVNTVTIVTGQKDLSDWKSLASRLDKLRSDSPDTISGQVKINIAD